jgi:hypothetical protein
VGGIVEQRDLLGASADQSRQRLVGRIDRRLSAGGGFVAADLGLKAQVVGDGRQRRLGEQPGAGV